ncbi:MAG: hypothetical protein KME64_12650 [Scytonematopsis contorta HA4267-MV1]|nr:hypothetical protein [Scytonematopsis contorta HA4267-MV1]
MPKRFVALGSIATLSTVNIATSLPVLAQVNPNIRINNDALQRVNPNAPVVDPSTVRIIRQNPIQYQAFEIKDPQTGQAISPDTVLTLPDGKKVKAGEYYAELNRLEQQFNQLGYSFRQPEEKVLLQESIIDKSILQRQVDAISSEHRKISNPNQSLFRSVLEPNFVINEIQKAPAIQINPGVLQNPQLSPQINPGNFQQLQQIQQKQFKPIPNLPIIPIALPPAPKTFTRSWGHSIGNQDRFYAYINGKLELKGSTNFTNAYAEGNAGGYIFNQQANLLRATANMNSQKSGNASAEVGLSAFGQSVYNFKDGKNTVFIKSDSFSRSYDKTIADVRFSLGPIPMRASFGVQASAGVNYLLIANPAYATAYAKVNPFVDSKAYGQGGADIVVGGAGVGANLTLLKDDLEIRAFGHPGIESGTNKPYFQVAASAYNEIEALSGNAYAYTYVYVPRFGIPPWRKKQWDWNIWSWTGFKSGGYLFDESQKIYL